MFKVLQHAMRWYLRRVMPVVLTGSALLIAHLLLLWVLAMTVKLVLGLGGSL